MKLWLTLVVLIAASPAFADYAPDARTRLRKLAKLPRASLQFGCLVDSTDGVRLIGEERDPEEAIAALQKAMRHEPSDAERYLQLARLYGHRENSEGDARQARDKSLELFRQQLESHPEDGPLLASYAEALSDEESEHVLRKGIQVAPNDWHCWSGLGDLLTVASFGALYHKDENEDVGPLEMLKRMIENKPTAAQLETSQQKLDEGLACHDKAVSLAPKEPKTYEKRGAARCLTNMQKMMRDIIERVKEADPRKLSMAYFSGGGEDDFKEVARLSPTNYQALGAIIMFEAIHEAFEQGDSSELFASWGKYPESSRKTVRETMTSLENLGDYPDKHVAAGALIVEGFAQYKVIGDLTASERRLWQATRLDPARGQAWEMLDAVLIDEEHFDDLAVACEARVKYKATPRALFLLAKAQERLNHDDKAEEQLTRVLSLAPDDFDANLGMAAMMLKHEGDHSLFKAANQLERAKLALGKLPAKAASIENTFHLMFMYGIYCGLANQPDAARKIFLQLLEQDKNNEDAKAALKAIGDWRAPAND